MSEDASYIVECDEHMLAAIAKSARAFIAAHDALMQMPDTDDAFVFNDDLSEKRAQAVDALRNLSRTTSRIY